MKSQPAVASGLTGNYRSAYSLLQQDQRIKHWLQNVGKRRFLCVHV